MIRRITLTFVPCVALYTVAACLASSLSPRVAATVTRTIAPTTITAAPQLAARSGYIVASS